MLVEYCDDSEKFFSPGDATKSLRREAYDDAIDYEEDFKKVIRERESHRSPFLHQSPQIAYRKCLVDYVKRICIEKSYSQSCLHLCVYILDVFMDNHFIIPEKLLIVANVSLMLAAKFEENIVNIPKIEDLNAKINNLYPREDYKNLELAMLLHFKFQIMLPTAAHYTYYYMRKMICFEDLQDKRNVRTLFYDLKWAITMFLDRVIEDVHYMQCFKPSKLAAAVISAARTRIGLIPWCLQLEDMTEYSSSDLKEPVEALLKDSILDCPNCRRYNNNNVPDIYSLKYAQ